MMSKTLVLIEAKAGKIKKPSLEVLTLANTRGADFDAVFIGEGGDALAAEAGLYGAKTLFTAEGEHFNTYNPEAAALALADAVEKSGADVVLGSSTVMARDLFPRAAAKLSTVSVSDCTEASFDGGELKLRRPMYAGKVTVAVQFENASKKFALVRPNQLPVNEAGGGAAAVTALGTQATDLRTLIKEVVKGTSEKLDLTEANIIVSGGRGMGEAGHFKMLEDLADVLGASVGASRAVCDAGWVPHSMQVGQTGKTVAPTLYIACGISGAIQHLAGMSASKVVVAINKDPEAPIFAKSTYGIVGDVFDVLPKLTEEFKTLLS